MHLPRPQFDALVLELAAELKAKLPPHLRADAETVLLATETRSHHDEILGLYEGVPLVERRPDDLRLLPDRITLFYQPLIKMCDTDAQLRHEIYVTLAHEFGHFFGFDEDELEARGWG